MGNLIKRVYGIAFEYFDVLDFTEDFLSGIRANYFKNEQPQANRVLQLVGDNEFQYIYTMRKGSPLSYKVNKNGSVYQFSEVFGDGYRVSTYGKNGRIFRRMYFDSDHLWIRSEYFSSGFTAPEYVLYPDDEQDAIVKIRTTDDSSVKTYLYPKNEAPENGDFSVLAFTGEGFLYFNTVPNERMITRTVIRDNTADITGGFEFAPVDFNLELNLNDFLDITEAEYLTEDNGNPYHTVTNPQYADEPDDMSAEDEEDMDELFYDEEDNTIIYNPKKKKADAEIKSAGESYLYYGSLNAEGQRDGYGRTVTPEGYTAYEGGYRDDKRDGFGLFNYKDGRPNYLGSWEKNLRNGFGVGFRGSDGTVHVGKWKDNVPEGMAARFDESGEFIFLGTYVDGKKQGKGITVDNGEFILSEFRDDVVVASYRIDELLKNL